MPAPSASSFIPATSTERRAKLRWVLITAAAAASMLLTASLGFWQLRRADQKLAYQAQLDARAALPALDGASLLQPMGEDERASLLHRQVVLQGEWLPQYTVFLDNRQMQARPGFYVLTPLRLAGPVAPGQPQTVLVQRGWVPRNFEDRLALPEVQTPAGTVQLEGRVAGQPARLFELQTSAGNPGVSRIRQNLDTDGYAQETGQPLAALTVVQTGQSSEGLLRDWPVVGSGVEKHYGYAFQWFGLCSLIAILYVWFQIVRRVLRRRSHPGPAAR
ncbi:SURF1 family protein [Comamonas sp.]|uniref:SURF1 family protein n=1 Tax=Comamonas sp. TaxID=34028 RepID=UPI0028999211|nr:SURF1 family protein [Comamonas sp.]